VLAANVALPPSEPPLVISSVPPTMVVPLAMPPDDTVSEPPLETVTLLVVVPARFIAPPLETMMLAALPPLEIFSTPPDDTVAKPNLPPESTSTSPPDRGSGSTRASNDAAGRHGLNAIAEYRDIAGDGTGDVQFTAAGNEDIVGDAAFRYIELATLDISKREHATR